MHLANSSCAPRTVKKAKKTWQNRSLPIQYSALTQCVANAIEEIMKFILIDKVVSVETGSQIRTLKSVSLAEEYLADHFPAFPVLPGVLLLEGLVESASWLVRRTEDFAHSMILLEQARNVKYRSFLAPGAQIEYTVDAKFIEENVSSFTGVGVSQGQRIVEARFGLRHFNLADGDAAMAAVDAVVIESMKKRWQLLWGGQGG
jgi:3-hydroxyacyl-[acyl-carrier-protein] dehydratase